MAKIERKYLAHFINAAVPGEEAKYVRLGKDLEEFNVELNPDVERKKNILGESSVAHNGYEVSTDASPFYYDYDDELSQKIMDIATANEFRMMHNKRKRIRRKYYNRIKRRIMT